MQGWFGLSMGIYCHTDGPGAKPLIEMIIRTNGEGRVIRSWHSTGRPPNKEFHYYSPNADAVRLFGSALMQAKAQQEAADLDI